MRLLFLLAALVAADAAWAQAPAVTLDGRFDEWDARPVLAEDAAGDGAPLDLLRLRAASDAVYLYVSVDLADEINLQSDNALTLYVDTDGDAATGQPVGGIGAEFAWAFGTRQGTATVGGAPALFTHTSLGLITAPTVTGTRFELALRRDASTAGRPLFSGPSVRLLLRDGETGDALPATSGGALHTLSAAPLVLPPAELGRRAPGDLRVLSYNVLRDGLFRPEHDLRYRRLFGLLDPDVVALQEVYTHTADQAAARLAELMPGTTWYGTGIAGSNSLVVARFPIRQTTAVCARPDLPSTCAVAARLDARARLGVDLHVVSMHPPCCTADAFRQQAFDALAAHLRDTRASGALPPGTPVVVAGDMNLVGLRRQQTTLLEGAILDTARYGPAAPPDEDGTAFADAAPRTTGLPATVTWTHPAESFHPGRLDYIVYSDATLTPRRGFVLYTHGLTDDERRRFGVLADDTDVSDHLPVVQDFVLRTRTSAAGGDGDRGGPEIGLVAPQPVGTSAAVRYRTDVPGGVRLVLHDALGRTVRVLVDGPQPAGEHTARLDRTGLAPGAYVLRLDTGGRTRTHPVVLR